MSIDIEPSRAFVRASDREKLVRAVLGASGEDESEWLEWKSTLDLGSAHGQFTVSKAVIGMANRDPQVAARFADGHGYLLVGVEPGSLSGVDSVESHVLEQALVKYLGDRGPEWTSYNVPVDGKNVLVVDVFPPRRGDRMYWLEKDYHGAKKGEGAHAGTVFVRRKSSTQRANSHEMHKLADRMVSATGKPKLNVDLAVASGALPVLAWTQDDVEEWLHQRERGLLASVGEHPATTSADGLIGMTTARQSLTEIASGMRGRDERSPDEYRDEVAEHLSRCRLRMKEAALAAYSDQELGNVVFRLTNPTESGLRDVEVKVHLAGHVYKSRFHASNEGRLPSKPRPFGVGPSLFENFAVAHYLPASPHDFLSGGGKFSAEDSGSVTAEYGPHDLHPGQTIVLDELYVYVDERPEDNQVPVEWAVTSLEADGIVTGTEYIPLGDDIDLLDLVDAP